MISSSNCVTCFAVGNVNLLPSREGEVAGLYPQSQGSVTNGCFQARLIHRSLAGSLICTCKKGGHQFPRSSTNLCHFLAFECRKGLAWRHDQTALKRHNIGPLQTHCNNGLPTAAAASVVTIGSPVPFTLFTMSSVDKVLWLQVPDRNLPAFNACPSNADGLLSTCFSLMSKLFFKL